MSERKTSEAKLRAKKKYQAKTYKTITVNTRIEDNEFISQHCERKNISKSRFLICAAKYCIEHDIDFE